ncbi:MAG: hypothetical protein V1773_06775 [bacterium]
MKVKLLILFVVFIGSSVFAQNVKVTDYQVPVSSARILRFNGGYNWAQTNKDGNVSSRNSNANANFTFNYFYSSLPFAWFLDVTAAGEMNDSKYAHDISISPSVRKYIWQDRNWFGYMSMNLQHQNTYDQIYSDVAAGYGYGRHIDATALAKAVRIEEHLIKENVIAGNLPKDVMIRIANIIEREQEYIGIYGATYETKWYEDIEEAIKSSYLLISDHVGAIGILRIQQVLKGINERVNNRSYGWDLTLGINYVTSTADKYVDRPAPALIIGGRYSYPITWRNQINAKIDIYTPVDSSFFKTFSIRGNAEYIYELSNKINFVTTYSLEYSRPINEETVVIHSIRPGFLFYLENQIYLTINAVWDKSSIKKTTLMRTSVSLQYNFF